MSGLGTLDFDDVLKQIGEMGTYQKTLYILLCIPACLPAAFLAFNQVFITADVDHYCAIPELDSRDDLNLSQRLLLGAPRKDTKCMMYDVANWTIEFQNNGDRWPDHPITNKTVPCKHGWIYDRSEYQDTIVTEMNLVCEQSWWPSTSTSLFYVGSLFGNIVFGHIADKYGRRTSFFTLLFMAVTLSIATAFSPNIIVYTIIRTLIGTTFPALFQIPFILCLEIMGPAYRTMAGMILCLFFAVALMILAGLAYAFNSWVKLVLVTSLPSVLLFVYWWLIPESPRWLLSTGRIDEAEFVVQKIAKRNKKDIPANYIHQLASQATPGPSRRTSKAVSAVNEAHQESEFMVKLEEVDKNKHVDPNIITMLRFYPVTRRNFILITLCWFANGFVYNGLSFYSAKLNVSSHLGFFISAVVEVPSYIVHWWVMGTFGRRWCLFETMMVGGLSCISCMFISPEASPWVTVTLAMIGKFQIAASFAVIYVYAGELMPTVVRSQAMGISSFICGAGLLIFPYMNQLGEISHVVPLIIMGSMSCAGGITALFMPETLWKHLPNTLEEAEMFGTDFKIFSCPSKSPDEDDPASATEAEIIQMSENNFEKNKNGQNSVSA